MFKDKIVWITGASSGVGEALAYEFAKKEAILVLSARRVDELLRVKQNCSNPNERILILPLDITNFNELAEKAKIVVEKFQTIDILINNAGVSSRGSVNNTLLSSYQNVFNINFFGALMLTKAVLPYMLKEKAGHIVFVSSVMGYIGTMNRSAYSASKHALNALAESLRNEIWRDNIRVCLISPGYMKTNISLNSITEDGSPLNKMDEHQLKGLDPQIFAKKCLRAIEKNKREVLVGRTEIMAIYLKRFFPRILAYILKYRKSDGKHVQLK